MSVAQLRTVCNHYGISVRDDNGKFITMTLMKEALAEIGVDATIFNKRSKISADLAIEYNNWRFRVNRLLGQSHNRIKMPISFWIGVSSREPKMVATNVLKKVGMDMVAKVTFFVERIRFDTELQLIGTVISFLDYGVDKDLIKHYPRGIDPIVLDFTYVHKHHYGVAFDQRRSKATMMRINTIIGEALNSATKTTAFAALNPSISDHQPEPIWFAPRPHRYREQCFKGECRTELRGKNQYRTGTELGIAKMHVSYKQQYQTFALYNFVTYLTKYPHIFEKCKMFLLSPDSRFHVDDSEISPAKMPDWRNYLDRFGYGARAQIVIYVSSTDKPLNNRKLQIELDSFIDYWKSSGVDDLIGRKSNNLVYNERLTNSIYYSLADSTDRQESIRDTDSIEKRRFSISKPLSRDRERFCAPKDSTVRDRDCIRDKWGISHKDLCGSAEDGKYPRSDLYFYHNGMYSTNYYYDTETCADRRRRRDLQPDVPDYLYDRHR